MIQLNIVKSPLDFSSDVAPRFPKTDQLVHAGPGTTASQLSRSSTRTPWTSPSRGPRCKGPALFAGAVLLLLLLLLAQLLLAQLLPDSPKDFSCPARAS